MNSWILTYFICFHPLKSFSVMVKLINLWLMVNPSSRHWRLSFFFFFFFNFFRATPAAYGGSQARSGIRTAAAGLWVRVRVTPDPSALYGNTGSLNHWARQGFLTLWATTGTPGIFFIQFQYYDKVSTSLAFVSLMLKFLACNINISTYLLYHTM